MLTVLCGVLNAYLFWPISPISLVSTKMRQFINNSNLAFNKISKVYRKSNDKDSYQEKYNTHIYISRHCWMKLVYSVHDLFDPGENLPGEVPFADTRCRDRLRASCDFLTSLWQHLPFSVCSYKHFSCVSVIKTVNRWLGWLDYVRHDCLYVLPLCKPDTRKHAILSITGT